jgi:hypothetical protein
MSATSDYTIWRDGRLLGHTDLALPITTEGNRGGRLRVTPNFAEVWTEIGPIAKRLSEATRAFGAEFTANADLAALFARMSPGKTDEERERAHAQLARFAVIVQMREMHAAMQAFGLELRDGSGALIPTRSIVLSEFSIPLPVPVEAINAEMRAHGVDMEFPMYIVAISE